ncbi:MAG: DUF885 domain-containing protein [Flavobacteriales bacterium]|jgi:uncharacterized protein (DUF885 family)|nr:DUF885 domain-containing protein [Flavobacteriales bacterium]
MKRSILMVSLLLIISACKDAPKNETAMQSSYNEAFDTLLETYYEEGLKLDPISATAAGDNRYNDQFPNTLSEDYIAKLETYYTSIKEQLNDYPDDTLSESQLMSKNILKWECDIHLEELNFMNNRYFPIDQMWSVNLFMGQLASGASAQPFNTVADYNDWLERVDGYLVWLKTAESNMRQGMKEGYVLPKSLVVKILPQLKEMTEPNVEKHLFYSPVTMFPKDFSEAEKEELTKKYERMVTEKVIPAYQSVHDFMANEYLPKAREGTGIDEIPNGAAYYQHQIKKYTTTNMTAEEIHQLGLNEVARISGEMEKIKNQVGYKGDLRSFFDYVRNNPELMPYQEPNEVIENFNAIYERMKPKIDVLFDLKPKTAFEVRRTEAFRENSSSAEYNPGSLDGTRPGIFYVPIPDATTYNVYSDESLFLHEAIPGHHYQISLTQENEDLPQFRKTLWYSGYGEGWALYCESLGKELGLFTDPYQYFGMLGAEMHRAIRLVVDTGMHAKGWTREEAIEYSLANEAESEASIISEIERYMANPGQALSYKIGQLKIRELRNMANKELGDAFDIKTYHNEVLETGCVPLALLEDKIERWIASEKEVE